MKRRITLSIALVLSIVSVSLMSSDSTANAARPQTFVADTGMIPLGANQLLRVTVVPLAGGVVPTGSVVFKVDGNTYAPGTCNDGVCKHFISSQTTSDPITLAPGEAVSVDSAPGHTAQFRLSFGSVLPNVRVNAFIIDATTNAFEGFCGSVQVAAGDIN